VPVVLLVSLLLCIDLFLTLKCSPHDSRFFYLTCLPYGEHIKKTGMVELRSPLFLTLRRIFR
ncbi:hypothetical protein, partial [Desulforamulus ruminis]|uniref:hypothetical protein n=1 Tax=Desulforamulus ruminis TaxID=1564 RepID=UPI002FDADD32